MIYKISRRSSNKLKIHVESSQLVMYGSSAESSGCVLRGALSLQLKKPSRFVSLNLCFYGSISVCWNQLLGNGHEREHTDCKVLINHKWSFLQPDKMHSLEAGHYTYEFELALPGNLPESTHVAKYYIVEYHLKASAQRAGILFPNYTTRQDIHLSRQNFSLSTEYLDPVTVANVLPDKISYEISMPTKMYGHGDTVPITVRATLLCPDAKLQYVSCIFKEYVTCRSIHGWYNGKNKSYSHMIQYTRRPLEKQQGRSYNIVIQIKIPNSLAEIQCDAQNDSARVKHKLKFVLSVADQNGNTSEVKAAVSIVVAVNRTMDGLPAYCDVWRTMPYDPVLMMALIGQENERENVGSNHRTSHMIYHQQNDEISSYLPNYSSIAATETVV
ncbi:hypothetical protein BD560DRAFT_336483 [Blakeslea trispora]|nr:hypothetical protein BD560DRAFT_336483 [Blakeslea trispora]